MRAKANPLRWLLPVVLGCAVGMFLVFTGIYFVRTQRVEDLPIVPVIRKPAGPPVTLSDESVRNDLVQVIQGQLTAFRKNDYPAAYHYASAMMHAQVPLPAFERMVRTGFPVIARSSAAEFGIALDNGQDAMMNVGIVGESGKIITYRYSLQIERGVWRINGVVRVQPEGSFL